MPSQKMNYAQCVKLIISSGGIIPQILFLSVFTGSVTNASINGGIHELRLDERAAHGAWVVLVA